MCFIEKRSIRSSFILLFFSNFISAMCTYVYHENLFTEDKIPTEYTAYRLLSSNPLNCSENYLAVPWTTLLNKKKLEEMAPKIRLQGGFTICQHTQYEKIIPILKKIGVTVLFTPHVPRGKRYEGITVLPFPHFPQNGIDPAPKKDILYSFVGVDWTHSVRRAMFSMDHPKNAVMIKRKKWHFWDSKTNMIRAEAEYKDVLSRSRFALCPRGVGPSTIRFWEALQAGAIPILIADDMSLPAGIDWDAAIIRVSERDVKNIPKIPASITLEVEEAMRMSCLRIHRQYSGNSFVSTIRHYYDV